MCIMLTDVSPCATELFDVAVEGDRRLLAYRNTISTGKNELMIVPFPLENGRYGEVELVEIRHLASCLDDVVGAFQESTDTDLMNYSNSGASHLLVHQIGNYRISVAPDLDDLQARVDWDKFVLPSNLEERMETLKDEVLYPYACGYVVAEVIDGSVSNDGFMLVYPDPGFRYFPTAHERGTGDLDEKRRLGFLGPAPLVELVKYDVVCYSIDDKENPQRALSAGFQRGIPTTRVAGGRGHLRLMLEKGTPLSRRELRGLHENQNLMIK